MSTRMREILVLVGVAVVSAIIYWGKVDGWMTGLTFGSTLSLVFMLLLAASLLVIFYLTFKGRMVERRVVFVYVGIAVSLPFFMSISQPIRISPEVQTLYDGIEALPNGSKVLISFDYDPPSAPELQPMAETFVRYCFDKNLKMVIMGLWPQGPQQANMAVDAVLEHPEYSDKKYGVDWVNLGFQTGNEFVIQRMGSDFSSMFPTDYAGRTYSDIPLVRNVKNFENIDYVFNLSAGYPGTIEWVQVAVDRYGVKLGAGNTAVQAPQCYPYLRSGQLIGILGGMNGAAEFEKITEYPGKGTLFMLSQSFSHVVVIAFIIIGNMAFFRTRGQKKK
ncbi:hypothetical protein GF377_06425 [candidate division GN15 bacterium]|nr:hypothetical protein [candidate division GN15 bacterium]